MLSLLRNLQRVTSSVRGPQPLKLRHSSPLRVLPSGSCKNLQRSSSAFYYSKQCPVHPISHFARRPISSSPHHVARLLDLASPDIPCNFHHAVTPPSSHRTTTRPITARRRRATAATRHTLDLPRRTQEQSVAGSPLPPSAVPLMHVRIRSDFISVDPMILFNTTCKRSTARLTTFDRTWSSAD